MEQRENQNKQTSLNSLQLTVRPFLDLIYLLCIQYLLCFALSLFEMHFIFLTFFKETT